MPAGSPLHAGLAGNANAILLPEFALDIDGLIKFLKRRNETMHSSIIAVAEAFDLGQTHQSVGIRSSEVKLHGVADTLMNTIEGKVPGCFELRTCSSGPYPARRGAKRSRPFVSQALRSSGDGGL